MDRFISRTILAGLLATAVVFAASTERPTPAPAAKPAASDQYERGKAAVAAGRYAEAVKAFEEANKVHRNNPDVLNMVAYSYRKTGNLDAAFQYYAQALKLRPRFPEAREYLGEAHVQAALGEIETLKSYGQEGDEARKELIEALKQAVAGL